MPRPLLPTGTEQSPRALRSLLNRRLHPYQLSTRSPVVAPTEPRVLLTVALPAVPLSFWSPLLLPETQVEISETPPSLVSLVLPPALAHPPELSAPPSFPLTPSVMWL